MIYFYTSAVLTAIVSSGGIRRFSTTHFLYQNDSGPSKGPKDPLYTIMDAAVSVADVRKMKPESRTVAHWRLLVDWDMQSQRPYVIVDPYDPRGLLYLSRAEYLLQSRVSLANDLILIVIARPGDLAPVPKTAPSGKKGVFNSAKYFQSRSNRLAWSDFLRLRRFSLINVEIKDGMVTVSPKSIERAVIVWCRQLLHYSGVTAPERRLSGFYTLTRALRNVLTFNGEQHLVARLKVSLFAVYSYLGGNPLKSTQQLGLRVRLSNGLPRIIPAQYRKEIREGNMTWIRVWVSILNIYRSFKVKLPDPNTAYATIRKPLPASMPNLEKFEFFARNVFPALVESRSRVTGVPLLPFTYVSQLGLIIRSAAANLRSSASLFGLILDAKAWMQAETNYIKMWFELHADHTAIALLESVALEDHFPTHEIDGVRSVNGDLFDAQESLFPLPPFKGTREEIARQSKERVANTVRPLEESGCLSAFIAESWKIARETRNFMKPMLGRLFNFAAPGGKLRTVAICDYWTQIAMKPVHEYIFSILKVLGGNDATFDQQGTVDSYWERGYKPHWSFDLSAATDSIPITLYIRVLAPFFMDKDGDYDKAYAKAELWAKIMTDRDFGIPSPKKGEEEFTGKPQFRTIRYGTGQPMGAYSSWATMALVHHALVQYSHWLTWGEETVSAKWFESYLVLGDDVDIAVNADVALNYQLACADFHVKIGLAKSLQSNSNFFEFANQRLCPSGNISPLSFLEDITSQTWNSRVEFASRIAKRFGLTMNPNNLFRLATSARQWVSLIPELSGKREPILTRFLHFILLGPLKTYWHSDAPISIESITHWLQHLNKELLTVAFGSEGRWWIDVALCKALETAIDGLISKAMDDLAVTASSGLAKPTFRRQAVDQGLMSILLMPLSAGFTPSLQSMGVFPSLYAHYRLRNDSTLDKGISQHSKPWLTAMKEIGATVPNIALLRRLFISWDLAKLPVPSRAPSSYLYIFYCALLHNKSVREQMLEVQVASWSLRDKVAAYEAKTIGKDQSPLAELVLLYWKASAIPRIIRLDRDGITTTAFGAKSLVAPQDLACELVNIVIPVMAKWTGIAVSQLPVLPKGGAGLYPSALRAMTSLYEKAAQAVKLKSIVYVDRKLSNWDSGWKWS